MLRKVQKLQLIWVGLGLIYNALSYGRLEVDEVALAPTNPLIGAVFMAICGALIFAGMKGARRSYKFGTPPLTAFLIYSGVLMHMMAYSSAPNLPGYASFGSWLAAILINIYGVSTLAVGSWIAWQRDILT